MNEAQTPAATTRPTLQELVVAAVVERLAEFQGHQRETARSLGISRWTLSRLIRKYQIPVPISPERMAHVDRLLEDS